MRFIICLLIFLTVLASSSFAFRNSEIDYWRRSLYFMLFSESRLNSSSWGLYYERQNLEAYLSATSTPDLLLFGIDRKYKLTDWLAFVAGVNGQKFGNALLFTIGLGLNAGGSIGPIDYSIPFLYNSFGNGASSADYGFYLSYNNLIVGKRELVWSGARARYLDDSSWLIGIEMDL